jgi:hypothetical protein
VGALGTKPRWAISEMAIRHRIIGHLHQRLQIEDWYRRHPGIDDQSRSARR